ncbi:hypothetical protein [Acaryochloris marina]|uniref:hypothetical protein n=1 Tax=Acaryochloris marina TaxID=155978 RepID=UPI0021C3B470|nr:hypothetical protein [Acaryochloris marina]
MTVSQSVRNARYRVNLSSVSWRQVQSVPKRVWWFAGAGAICTSATNVCSASTTRGATAAERGTADGVLAIPGPAETL